MLLIIANYNLIQPQFPVDPVHSFISLHLKAIKSTKYLSINQLNVCIGEEKNVSWKILVCKSSFIPNSPTYFCKGSHPDACLISSFVQFVPSQPLLISSSFQRSQTWFGFANIFATFLLHCTHICTPRFPKLASENVRKASSFDFLVGNNIFQKQLLPVTLLSLPEQRNSRSGFALHHFPPLLHNELSLTPEIIPLFLKIMIEISQNFQISSAYLIPQNF